MKWIELIVVRATGDEKRSTIRRLIDQFIQNRQPAGLEEIILYRNAFVETDVVVYLEWAATGKSPTRSDLGIGLAATLEEFGRVHHTIWIEDGMRENEE
jgi:hypothetical protein